MSAGSIRTVAVFTGSSSGSLLAYEHGVIELGHALADNGVGVVFGGGRVGLMGTVADAVLRSGGTVTGVIPQALVDREIAHTGLSELEVVADLHARKLRMSQLGDAFVALPGGAGTLDELFEAWTWLHLGIHSKPVALYEIAGYWQPLLDMLDHMVGHGFLAPSYRDSLTVARTPDELLRALDAWRPPGAAASA